MELRRGRPRPFTERIDAFLERCTGEQKKQCARDNGAFLEEACRQCPKGKIKPSAYIEHLFNLYALQQGGYPFDKDDLALEVWTDLGVLASRMEAKRRVF